MLQTNNANGYTLKLYPPEIARMEYIQGKQPVEDIKSAYARLGCDLLINANFFGLLLGNTVGHVVDDGKVVSNEYMSDYGVSFVDKRYPIFNKNNEVCADDYINGYPCLVWHGKKNIDTTELAFSSNAIPYKRGRTAIGVCADGQIIIRVIPDTAAYNRLTIPELAAHMLSQDCLYAINLDGGGSSQYIAAGSSHTNGRALDGFIALWFTPKIYRVQTGAFTIQANAQREQASAISKGFSKAFINDKFVLK